MENKHTKRCHHHLSSSNYNLQKQDTTPTLMGQAHAAFKGREI